MKKYLLSVSIGLFTFFAVNAQTTRPLKKVLELKMPDRAEDDMPGTRGASVVWHPLQKKYYAAFAGNEQYPLAVFNAAGKKLSSDNQSTLFDIRGLWYNPVKKQLCGNAYETKGRFSYQLNSLGLISDYKTDIKGMYQPGEQSVGTYHVVKKQVMFLSGSEIWFYNDTILIEDKKTVIHWGLTKQQGIVEDEDVTVTPESYNNNSIIYSGIPGADAGVLNVEKKQIELYNSSNGFLSRTLILPKDAVVEASFNFAFANGIYWLFNIEARKWIGYK